MWRVACHIGPCHVRRSKCRCTWPPCARGRGGGSAVALAAAEGPKRRAGYLGDVSNEGRKGGTLQGSRAAGTA